MKKIKNPKSEQKISEAIRFLMEKTGQELILAGDNEKHIYVLPAILKPNDGNYDETEFKIEAPFVIEYQVSNGIHDRSQSTDVYSFKEAMRMFSSKVVNLFRK